MLAYLFLSKVANFTQNSLLSAIFPYVHFCLTIGQEHWHSRIFWHNSILWDISIRWHISLRWQSSYLTFDVQTSLIVLNIKYP